MLNKSINKRVETTAIYRDVKYFARDFNKNNKWSN